MKLCVVRASISIFPVSEMMSAGTQVFTLYPLPPEANTQLHKLLFTTLSLVPTNSINKSTADTQQYLTMWVVLRFSDRFSSTIHDFNRTEQLGRLSELDILSSCVDLKVNYRAIDYCQVKNVTTTPLGLLCHVGLWCG